MTYDYSAFTADAAPGEEAFATLKVLLDQLEQCKGDVLDQEDALKRAQTSVRDLEEQQIPDLLEAMNLEKFTTSDGRKVELKSVIRTSITAANKVAAYRWLINHGFGDLIKCNVVVALGRGDQETAQELVTSLHEKHANVRQDLKVEPATLKAFVTEQLEEGADIPTELFGVFRQRKVKVK